MKRVIDRRSFMKTTTAVTAGMGLAGAATSRLLAGELADGAPNAEKLGWRLGCQAYCFRMFTFYEAVDKVASLGLHYIEGGAGHSLSKEKPDIKTAETLPADIRKEIKKRLADAGIKMPNYYTGLLVADEGECRKTFEFAKEMGIETFVSEPVPEALDTIEKLCDEYQVNLAIHNHPEPSRYWNPDTVLEACRGRSKRIGACADTGHWMRSGIRPVDALKKLEGRIISFHLKDLNKYGRQGSHDVPWGTGKGDVKGMLTEVRRQGIKAVFSAEYEHNWLESLPEIAQCVKYFDKVAAELAVS